MRTFSLTPLHFFFNRKDEGDPQWGASAFWPDDAKQKTDLTGIEPHFAVLPRAALFDNSEFPDFQFPAGNPQPFTISSRNKTFFHG
jgi:hypothetical protein